ncbi:MAG: hypothetical protein ACFCUO_02435 [Rhodospirillales bacterium]
MEPSDVTLLIALGTAGRAPASFADIVAAAKEVAPADWQPTVDTLRATVERAIMDGLIAPRSHDADRQTVLSTTPSGRLRIVALLRKPIPRASGGFVRTCMSAKLWSLDHLPPPERGDHVRGLRRLYRDAIDELDRLRRLPAALAGSAAAHLGGDIARLEGDLAWLDAMAAWPSRGLAAEQELRTGGRAA